MDYFDMKSCTFGANCSIPNSSYEYEPEEKFIPLELPPSLSVISKSSLICVLAYCVVFIAATSGNLIVLYLIWKDYTAKRTRILLLLLNLSMADLIVCCTLIPTEVVWRLTIQWFGGNVLCKLIQFCRAFRLYLSSLVLICVSFDRFLAIVFPLQSIKIEYYQKIKFMLKMAWGLAALFSVPQAIFFGVQSHPEFPQFKQCVTNKIFENWDDVKIYSVFSVAAMYIVPLTVILFTYSAIIIKLARKSRQPGLIVKERNVTSSFAQRRNAIYGGNVQDGNRVRPVMQLRCNNNAEANLSKAKCRTLLMTVVIVAAFVICWTPYAVMTLWYMIDWEGAAKVDSGVQDGLFLMAVGNSCINPIIYGTFQYTGNRVKSCFKCQ